MAHVQGFGDVGHRQSVFVRLPNRLIAVGAERLGGFFQVTLAPCVLLRKGGETRANFGRLALRAGDLAIVRPIPANRLA